MNYNYVTGCVDRLRSSMMCSFLASSVDGRNITSQSNDASFEVLCLDDTFLHLYSLVEELSHTHTRVLSRPLKILKRQMVVEVGSETEAWDDAGLRRLVAVVTRLVHRGRAMFDESVPRKRSPEVIARLGVGRGRGCFFASCLMVSSDLSWMTSDRHTRVARLFCGH